MSSRPRQSISELKLRRATEYNKRLREDLARPSIRVSEASASLIRYCKTTKDHLVRINISFLRSVPSVWGPVGRSDDPYAPQGGGCSCTVQ
ncbi:hypothetical protein PLICRDRAFT_175364 [Plicaturopsis crispa FD-325 SS-3]|nr:hypothetical protein PLICRDRAFT_175364 [Plicaturopsis crispa FD-325 SS-3]